MMKFILATTNKNKLSEINDISKDYGINFELPQNHFEVNEDGQTLYENALKKAQTMIELQGNSQGSALKKAEFMVGHSRANASEPVTGNTNRWLGLLSRIPPILALKSNRWLGLLSRLWHPPSFHSVVFPTAVINCFKQNLKLGRFSFCFSHSLRLEPETECKDYDKPNKISQLVDEYDNYCILSDDTGLFVEALNGAPGIHSARYDTTPDKRIQKLLNALDGKNNRNAKFVCSMVLLSSNGDILYTSTGEIEGKITTSTKGINGFGYDPIFFIESLNKTMAQLTKEEKNTISHRAKALIPILEFIKTNIL